MLPLVLEVLYVQPHWPFSVGRLLKGCVLPPQALTAAPYAQQALRVRKRVACLLSERPQELQVRIGQAMLLHENAEHLLHLHGRDGLLSP